MAKRFSVKLPEFDPDLDVLYIEAPGGATFEFIADLAVLQEVQRIGRETDSDLDDPGIDQVISILVAGLRRRHPDITPEEVSSWFTTPKSLAAISDTLQEYMEHVSEGMGEDGSGEVPTTPGSTSGRTASTTSKSRRKK